METIIYSPDIFKKMQLDVDIEPTFRFTYMNCIDKQKGITMKLMVGLISMIKLFMESSGFPLNDFCLNYEKMGFLEIGGRPINSPLWCVKIEFLKITFSRNFWFRPSTKHGHFANSQQLAVPSTVSISDGTIPAHSIPIPFPLTVVRFQFRFRFQHKIVSSIPTPIPSSLKRDRFRFQFRFRNRNCPISGVNWYNKRYSC